MNCVNCNQPSQLFWLKDDTWNQIREKKHAEENGFILCFECATKVLERPLTLHDLALSYYLKTEHMPRKFLQEYARSTLHGAYQVTSTLLPEGWVPPHDRPFTDAFEIGIKLGKQTPNSQEKLADLLREYKRYFTC
jgi:hypothetical protein